jgi:hypothetical protein
MKTSLQLDDALFQAAVAEARRTGRTISETVSTWARLGQQAERAEADIRRPVPSLELGGPATVDLSSRRDWMDALDR